MGKRLSSLVWPLAVLLAFASCGEDSENDTTPPPSVNTQNPVNPVTPVSTNNNINGTCGNYANFNDFKAAVNNNNFRSDSSLSFNGQSISYFVVVFQDEVKELFGINWLNYSVINVINQGYLRSSTPNSDIATHERYGSSKTQILDNLKSLVNGGQGNITDVYPTNGFFSSSVWTFKVEEQNTFYTIDLCYPIAANPRVIYEVDTNTITQVN